MKWKRKEEEILKEKYPKNSNNKLSLLLDRSSNAIRNKAYKLGIKKDNEWISQVSSHKNIISHRKGLTIEQEYGKEIAKELREKNRSRHLGQIAWNKGIKGYSTSFKGKKHSEEHKKKLSETKKKQFQDGLLPGFIGGEGINNPSWKGGKSFEPYDKGFNNKFKRAIRKRDNQICMLCGIHKEKLKKVLFIHHINYNKLLSIPQNCVSLCNSCHTKTNTNRNHWTKFFQSLLSEKHGYEYSENKEVIFNLN